MSDKETKALIDETTNEVDDVFPPSQSQSQVPDSSDGAGDGKASVVEEGPDDQEVDDAFAPSQSQSNVQESIACAGEAKASAADQGGQPQELDQEKQVELEREKQLLSDEKLQEEKNRLFWQKIRAERERKKAVAQRKRDAAAMQKDENEEVHGKVAKNQGKCSFCL